MNRSFHVTINERSVRYAALAILAAGLLTGSSVAFSSGPSDQPGEMSAKTSDVVTTSTAQANGGRVIAHSPAAKSDGGLATGIKVKGWWTIEVRNPDGKVASHTEFENALVTNQSTTVGGWGGTSGDYAMAHLLTSNVTLVLPGNLGAVPIEPLSGSVANLTAALAPVTGSPAIVNVAVPFLSIAENTSTAPSGLSGAFGSLPFFNFPLQTGAVPICVGGVCPDATTATVNGNSISLSKTSTATQSGTISTVGTFLNINLVEFNLQSSPTVTVSQNPIFSGPLTGAHQVSAAAAITSFTLSPLSATSPPSCAAPPCVVQVTTGQTVSMNVTISFN